MNPILISFFNKQKNPHKFTKKINTETKNNPVPCIFSQYLFIENILYKEICVPTNKNYNIYSSFIHFSSINNPIYYKEPFSAIKIDSFAFYMAIQLAFKVKHTSIIYRPNDLSFFCYYNKAFIDNFSVLKQNSASKNTFIINKYNRLDYQRKLQTRMQTNFIFNGVRAGCSFFNRIFSKNNTHIISSNNKTSKFFSKKLRSTKAIRGATLEDNYTKRFKSSEQLTSFIKVYKNTQSRQHSVTSIFKSKAIFPQYTWFRNQVTKVVNRQKKVKKPLKVNTTSLSHYKKTGSNFKAVTPSALQFKLFPTEYSEATLNPNRFSQFKALASFITHSNFSFYQINALSLTRFIFDREIKDAKNHIGSKRKLSQSYLNSRERERVSRYRYIGIYIKDLIRVCFFSMYLKKADFLASFFAFTISKLPRNRKELKYVHFLIKLLKRFSSRNKDILGIRIRFQGRLNRWRRTKHIIGSKGNIAFSRYQNRIEYGIAQAITRKGTLGVHVWIAYRPGSFDTLSEIISSYINISPRVSN